MPILAIDKNGQIYQTSRDRADGLGFDGYAQGTECGDVTLGSAYLKSQRDYRNGVLKEAKLREEEDRQAKILEDKKRREGLMNAKREEQEIKLLDDELYQKNLVRKALKSGCGCEMKSPMSGNVLTSNGQSGWAGMDQTQKSIHRHLNMGESAAFQVDPLEQYQYNMKLQADRLIHSQAQKDASRVKAEAAQRKLEADLRAGKAMRPISATRPVHPFLSIFKWR